MPARNDDSRAAARATAAAAEEAYSGNEHNTQILLSRALTRGDKVVLPTRAVRLVLRLAEARAEEYDSDNEGGPCDTIRKALGIKGGHA